MSGPINLGAVRKAHEKFIRRNEQMVSSGLEFAGDAAADHVRKHSKFKRRSANSLKDATKHRIIRTSRGGIVRITSAKKYASFVEYGTRPHYIFARKGFLKFNVGGKTLFRLRVRHPGTPAFRFLYNATDAAGRATERYLASEMERLAKTF